MGGGGWIFSGATQYTNPLVDQYYFLILRIHFKQCFSGHGDRTISSVRAGCLNLLHTVQSRVKPKYHVFGHIHEGQRNTMILSCQDIEMVGDNFLHGWSWKMKKKLTNKHCVCHISIFLVSLADEFPRQKLIFGGDTRAGNTSAFTGQLKHQ